MQTLSLSASKRNSTGKGVARQIRLKGGIPAIVYGPETEPTALQINAHEFGTVLKKSTSEHILVDLNLDGGKSELALIKEVQHDPITEDVLHVDFQHIDASKPIRVTIPVRLSGLPEGVKNFGGILQQTMRDVQAEGLPADLPDSFEVDVTPLNIHEAIHVSDLSAERVTIVSNPERTIASVVPPTVAKEVVEGEGVPAEGEEGEAAEGEAAEGDEKKEDSAGADKKDK